MSQEDSVNKRLRKLLEDRAAAWSQVQDIQARRERDGYKPTDEDGETYTRALDDVDRLSTEIETEERAERQRQLMDGVGSDRRDTNPRPGEGEGEDRSDDPEAQEKAYRKAFGAFLRGGLSDLDAASAKMLRDGYVGLDRAEARALGVGTGSAGGYTVPTEYLNKMVETMKAFGGILSVAEVITTADGAPMQWATNDDTNNAGALLSENSQVTEQDFTFGTNDLAAWMYTSRAVRASFQILQDSQFDMDSWLPRKLGERIGRALAPHLVTGDGVNKPQGLITGLQSGGTSSTATGIAYDDLIDLEFSIDGAYRNSPNLRYVFADSALKALRKVKDADGRPLWVPSVTVGVPSTINGKPYITDYNMDAVAAGSKSVIFGDIRAAYVVRQVQGAQVLRLVERYADYGQVGFIGFARYDAAVQDASAARYLTQKAS